MLQKHFNITAILLMLLLPIPSLYAQNRALLVGVGDYAYWPLQLPGVQKDLDMMQQTAQYLGFRHDQIKILQHDAVNYKNLHTVFQQWLIQGVKPTDRILFYFTGHGTQIPDQDGDEIDKADEALVLYDTQLSANKKALLNVLRDDELADLLNQIPSNNILLLVDACHNGTSDKSLSFQNNNISLSGKAVSKFFEYPNMPRSYLKNTTPLVGNKEQNNDKYIILTAAADDEKALTTKNGSLFTRGIFQIIQQAVQQKRNISLKEIQTKTARYIENKILTEKLGAIHHPQIGGNIPKSRMIIPLFGG